MFLAEFLQLVIVHQISAFLFLSLFAAGGFILYLVKRRKSPVNLAFHNQLRHEPVEERQKQRTDMRAVYVRIGQDNNLVVAELFDVEFVADAAAECSNHGFDFVILQNLFKRCFLDIENLTAEGKNRLRLTVTSRLYGTARGIPLDQINLAFGRLLRGAGSKLTLGIDVV